MIETRTTKHLSHSTSIQPLPNVLTPNISILVVLLVGGMLWLMLGGVTLDTTFALNVVIKVPAWLMFLGGLLLVIATVFGIRYARDYL